MGMRTNIALVVCLLAGTTVLSVANASPALTSTGHHAGSYCRTPDFYTPQSIFKPRLPQTKRFQLASSVYTLTSDGAAWINNNTKAYLEGDILLTTKQAYYVIFCYQALYDRLSGTIQLSGNVRVTEYPAEATTPHIIAGDTGCVSLYSPPAPLRITVEKNAIEKATPAR